MCFPVCIEFSDYDILAIGIRRLISLRRAMGGRLAWDSHDLVPSRFYVSKFPSFCVAFSAIGCCGRTALEANWKIKERRGGRELPLEHVLVGAAKKKISGRSSPSVAMGTPRHC
jgi:hypothetical protein